jgi:CRISPR-associated protein Cas1
MMKMTILIVEGHSKVCRKSGNIAVVSKDGSECEEVAVPDLELVVLLGERISISSSALLTLLSYGVPVVVVSGRSDVYGVLLDIVQVGSANVREVQYKRFNDEYYRLKYAKPVIISRLKGLYNVLRYELKYHREAVDEDFYQHVRTEILSAIEEVEECKNVDEIRRLEAQGSRAFWKVVTKLIPEKYEFTGRDPQKIDPINLAINFTYAVLYGIVTKGIVVNGLDPFYGLLHTSKPGRTSLTYDLSEIFKPIAVHTVIQASRKVNITTFRGSRLLRPRTIEALIARLYNKLSEESEALYKRRSIWQLPLREVNKFKEAVLKGLNYEPYTYNPSS